MSSFCEYAFECACGAQFTARLWESVNVATDPQLLEEILRGELNAVTCPACGVREGVDKTLLVHDPARGLMVFVYPADKEEEWEERDERAIREVASFLQGLDSEGVAKEVRVVFGMEALAELLAGGRPGHHGEGAEGTATPHVEEGIAAEASAAKAGPATKAPPKGRSRAERSGRDRAEPKVPPAGAAAKARAKAGRAGPDRRGGAAGGPERQAGAAAKARAKAGRAGPDRRGGAAGGARSQTRAGGRGSGARGGRPSGRRSSRG